MSSKDPIWVLKSAVTLIHKRQLAEHGGLDGIRDDGMLESALVKPQNLYSYSSPTPTLAQLAASYAFGIARNHPFIDGNKRTALVVCELFLRLNRYAIEVSKEEKYSTFMSLAEGTLSEKDLANWLSKHIISRI